jgi:hypothetical protein
LSSLKKANLLTSCANTSLSMKLLHQEGSQSQFLHCRSCFSVFDRGGAHYVREVSRGKICVLIGPPASHRYSRTSDSLPAIHTQMTHLLCRSSYRCRWYLKHCEVFRA